MCARIVGFREVHPLTQPRRDSWVRQIVRGLGATIKTKFALGRAEYGCDFGEQSTDYIIDQIEKESIDLLMYVRELKRRRVIDDQQIMIEAIRRREDGKMGRTQDTEDNRQEDNRTQ